MSAEAEKGTRIPAAKLFTAGLDESRGTLAPRVESLSRTCARRSIGRMQPRVVFRGAGHSTQILRTAPVRRQPDLRHNFVPEYPSGITFAVIDRAQRDCRA